jgi:hypothetical protein
VLEDGVSNTLHIELENSEGVYRSGAAVRGRLALTLASEQHPRRISLHAIGTEFTHWGAQPAYIARTHPLDRIVDLWRPAREGESLPAGAHTYPFEIALPPNLPPSFDGVLTEIGYGLKAKVDLPFHVDLRAEIGLIVLAQVPAIAEPTAPVTAHDESGRQIGLELPRSVYRLGETIRGSVRIARPGAGRSRRLVIELLSRERGSAQGIWAEDVEREADSRVELEHVAEDSSYPFAFKVPDSAAPTFQGEHSELNWHVRARLDVARSHDLIAEVKVTIVEQT